MEASLPSGIILLLEIGVFGIVMDCDLGTIFVRCNVNDNNPSPKERSCDSHHLHIIDGVAF
jgi:hypothetical protein